MPFGFTVAEWVAAKKEITEILRERAGAPPQGMMPYGELCQKLHCIQLTPHEPAMGAILGEISQEEFRSGRGMLSVIVVHKDRDKEPGPGFYECAKALGLDVSDRQKLWISELHKVHAYWSKHP